ncbi:hypothetical protein EAI89_03560 [Eubacterium sp. am_0171]|uniref:Uncharacterized protein n=1 Tax=Faecalicatena contorta TaxID=39482 RepID=A0A174HDQ8_9FIRM|nr:MULTISPECIES: hypothetical protein [Clostridia]MSC83415.1 hypothetical protein [Eubacterium sp. BIOML-A1]MSD05247.1 hypothetical protein [Eubacterium sp. BIOML-A2]RYT24906.1 hypothetical protein EAI89_03560 [Eubacterium sp. am_0171]CUO72974.1 Uncharacterised protein [[Eubacterium] contortum] [Faecalicatena contorta]
MANRQLGKIKRVSRPTDQREESKGDRKMQGIAEMLRKIQFRKKWFGGVDEADVWRQIDELQKEYEKELLLQKERYRTLLREREAKITHLKKKLADAEWTWGDVDG